MKKQIRNFLLLSMGLSLLTSLSYAQEKTIGQLHYESIYGKPVDEKNTTPKGKYDSLSVYKKQKYNDIDKNNSDILNYQPEKYQIDKTIEGTRVNPSNGAAIYVDKNNSSTLPNIRQSLNSPNHSTSSVKSIFQATTQHRKISSLVNSWSGKGVRLVYWDYSKDYSINNSQLFNQEAKLDKAGDIDSAINSIFRYIGLTELNNPSHIPPKVCYEKDTIRIIDFDSECQDE